MTKNASIIAALLFLVSCRSKQPTGKTNFVYEIPNGLRGWVRVDYEQPRCPALTRNTDGSWLVRISERGLACTSSSIRHSSWSDSTFSRAGTNPVEMVASEGDPRREIWLEGGAIEECPQGRRPFETFFVGTKEERARAADPPACPELPLSVPEARTR